MLNFKTISGELRENMGVIPLIESTLFPALTMGKPMTAMRAEKEPASRINRDVDPCEVMREKRAEMVAQINQFRVFKEILDNNCCTMKISLDSLRTLDIDSYELASHKFKVVDCKLMHHLLEDLGRHDIVAKVSQD